MKNEITMPLLLVLSFFMLIILGSVEVSRGFALVWFIGLIGVGGAFLLSLGSMIHNSLMKHIPKENKTRR